MGTDKAAMTMSKSNRKVGNLETSRRVEPKSDQREIVRNLLRYHSQGPLPVQNDNGTCDATGRGSSLDWKSAAG